jgi:hypothetical protein
MIDKDKLRLSPTKILLYQQCPYKFKKQVIDKDYKPSIWLDLGSVTHGIIEELTKNRMEKDTSFINLFIDDYLDKTEYNNTEKQEIKKTSTNMVDTCYNSIDDFIRKLEDYYVEMWFETNLNGFKFVGKSDLIGKSKNGNYYIVDYKTSKPNKKTGLHYETDFDQWLMYALLFRIDKRLEGLNPICRAWYLRTNTIHEKKFTNDDIDKIFIKAHCILDMIDNDIYNYNKSGERKGFHPKRNKFCNWCDYNRICRR